MARVNRPHLPQGKMAEHPLMVQLIHRRVALGWTQEQLAKATGFSQASIDSWERGVREPNITRFTRLASVLGFIPLLEKEIK